MLAHSLNMRIIAEGVETNAQLATLSTLHCDVIQGYLISKSLPDADVLLFLEAFVTPCYPNHRCSHAGTAFPSPSLLLSRTPAAHRQSAPPNHRPL